MRNRTGKVRANTALGLESLELRCLRAGVIEATTLDTELSGKAFDPSTDLEFTHDVLSLTGAGQTVAIIDSGIAYDHYALGGGLGSSYRVVGGWDFAENDADPYDDGPLGYHGTHIAGIVGSSDDDAPGLAPGVDLVALRVFDDAGHGDFDWIESALAWVHDNQHSFEHPITTVNLSVGAGDITETVTDWTSFENELARLADDGIFVAVAAGNSFRKDPTAGLNFPAASSTVIPVASVNADGQLSEFSDRDQRVIAAPGELINSTVPDYLYGFDGKTDDFAKVSGTSMATPFVAGASVLVRQAFHEAGRTDVTVPEIYQHLYDTADVVSDTVTNADYRRLDLRSALESILDTPAPALSTTIEEPSLDPVPAAVHLGSLDAVTIQGEQGEWFEFVASETGVMLIDSPTAENPIAEELSGVSLFDGNQRIDEKVDNETGGRAKRFAVVEKGQTYRVRVPASIGQVRLAQAVSVDGEMLDVRGDRATRALYVEVGDAFVVTARGVRENIDVRGRLQDNSLDRLTVRQTRRGVVVRFGVEHQAMLRRVPASLDFTTALNAGHANFDAQYTSEASVPVPLAVIEVGFQGVQLMSERSLLSTQAADAMFAVDSSRLDLTVESGDMQALPIHLLDDLHSERTLLQATVDTGGWTEISDDESEAVDQILGLL